MKPDYSHYRMMHSNDVGWAQEYITEMGYKPFHDLLNKRYAWLMEQKEGWQLDLLRLPKLKDERTRDLLIKTICLFISEGNPNYRFNSSYTIISKDYEQKRENMEGERKTLSKTESEQNVNRGTMFESGKK